MTKYSMTPISNNTRIRENPNTASAVLVHDVPANEVVIGDELFTATQQLSNTHYGVYQNVGDKWLKVTRNGVVGWMAYIHKGVAICDNFKVISDTPEPTPPVQMFPNSFVLTDPSGAKAEYVFVRVL